MGNSPSNDMNPLRAPPELQNDEDIKEEVEYQQWVEALEFGSLELQNECVSRINEAGYQQWAEALEVGSMELQNEWVSRINEAGYQQWAEALEVGSMELQNEWVSKIESDPPELQNDQGMNEAVEYQQRVEALEVGSDPWALKDMNEAVEYQQRVEALEVGSDPWALKDAPGSIQNNRDIVMAAVRKEGRAIRFASPELRNDEDIKAVGNDEDIKAVQYNEWMSKIDGQRHWLAKVEEDVWAKTHITPSLNTNKQVVMAAISTTGWALKYASPSLQNDKQVVMAALEKNPDVVKFAHDDLKRDKDILIAAGMYNEDHQDSVARQQLGIRKVVLSTRFSLNPTSESEATNFTAKFKESEYIQMEGNFEVYAPNANNKNCCDPTFTDFNHPCRGTEETCEYNNVLTTEGHPTDDCCWRYSFRSQLQEAKDTGGFMLQLVETGEHDGYVNDATLGMGQTIELDMANTMGVKVFQVYRPEDIVEGREMPFFAPQIDVVVAKISQWYDNQCQDMSVEITRQRFKLPSRVSMP